FQTIDQITSELGKTDDIDIDIMLGAVDVFLPDILNGISQHLVIDKVSLRILTHQWNNNHAGSIVIGNQAAHHIRAANIDPEVPNTTRAAIIIVGQYRATGKPFLGNLSPAYYGGENGF